MDLHLLALSLLAWLWPVPLALVVLALLAHCSRPLRPSAFWLALGSAVVALVLLLSALSLAFSQRSPSPAANLPLFVVIFALTPLAGAVLLLRLQHRRRPPT